MEKRNYVTPNRTVADDDELVEHAAGLFGSGLRKAAEAGAEFERRASAEDAKSDSSD